MEDRALMFALAEIITTVDKMRGTTMEQKHQQTVVGPHLVLLPFTWFFFIIIPFV